MSAIDAAALAVVVLAGVYLLGLGAASLLAPTHAQRFLLGFASSMKMHLLEQFMRLAVGAALIVHAPQMPMPEAFRLFGQVLLLTAAALLLTPWRLHQRFARRVVPLFTRHVAWLGAVSLAIGGGLLGAVAFGGAQPS